MRISFAINNLADEPGFLHPISAWSEIQVRPEDMCLSDDDFLERHVRPLVKHAKEHFMQMQEEASNLPPLGG